MTAKDLKSVERAALFVQRGSHHWVTSLTLPFVEKVGSELTAAGFGDSLEAFHIPPGVLPPRKAFRPRAALAPVELLIGVTLFVGASIGSWVVKKICDEVFEKKIRPGFEKLKEQFAHKKGKITPPPMKLTIGIWYDVDQLYVQVIAEVTDPKDFDRAADLILDAQRAALTWVDAHGVTTRVLTYRIRHGELSGRPALSDKVSEE